MNKIKQLFYLSALTILIFGCGNDDQPTNPYPQLFQYDTYENTEYQEFLVGANETTTNVSQTQEQVVLEGLNLFFQNLSFYIEEFELESEENVRIKLILDNNQVFDSTLVYSIDGNYIDITGFDEFGTHYLEFDQPEGKMYARYQGYLATVGPNNQDPEQGVFGSINLETSNFENIDDHLQYLLDTFEFEEGDRIAIFSPRRIYQ